MKHLKFSIKSPISSRKKQSVRNIEIQDFYQASVEKVGSAQLAKLAEKGLSMPIVLL